MRHLQETQVSNMRAQDRNAGLRSDGYGETRLQNIRKIALLQCTPLKAGGVFLTRAFLKRFPYLFAFSLAQLPRGGGPPSDPALPPQRPHLLSRRRHRLVFLLLHDAFSCSAAPPTPCCAYVTLRRRPASARHDWALN